MAGTSEGGKKSHNTILKKRGRDYIRERNSRAGASSRAGGFKDKKLASEAAKKSWENRRKAQAQ